MASTLPSKSLLVVDDDAVACQGLATILEREGYRVVTAQDSAHALNRLRAGLAPDLILLDMVMPAHDGWYFFRQRRQDKEVGAIPVLIMTGLPIANEEWGSALGGTALLRKPLDVTVLLETVRSCLSGEKPKEDRPC